ncbi:uncharacterized protein LOC143377929 [Andrena cerasifolii]|uniref:uncharacterized protein LOC143377929 n=1 Tax=Andrena cerasifolii TaxID=2819439 RepID=UPI004037D6B1
MPRLRGQASAKSRDGFIWLAEVAVRVWCLWREHVPRSLQPCPKNRSVIRAAWCIFPSTLPKVEASRRSGGQLGFLKRAGSDVGRGRYPCLPGLFSGAARNQGMNVDDHPACTRAHVHAPANCTPPPGSSASVHLRRSAHDS